MEIFGSPLFDAQDFYELVFRFLINLVAFVIIRMIYYPIVSERTPVHLHHVQCAHLLCELPYEQCKASARLCIRSVCVFGILRYRTEALPIKEMTYLFIVITVAVINNGQ